ncbi:entericidin A/B family lipoprotein [Nitrosomonas mobilis]|mgnify:FL=1|nr:entericidin A/B family lipoprotein [Nitrosomonas mobilis]HNO74642.1 entericidin A/B family lipoprotein [Nitrosomonas mobilis]
MKNSCLLLLLVLVLSLSSCNTMQGLGKDVQRGGEAIEKTAK